MRSKLTIKSVKPYWELMRFHRPIGILLLLWPTWWALWLAAEGFPDLSLLLIFTLGVIVMRAAGCVINDIADRDIDKHVARTQQRPLARGQLTVSQAKKVFIVLIVIALFLVLLTNPLTIYLSFVAVALACIYPFMKRYSHLPQVVLGAAFSMSIPMAFAAQTDTLEPTVIIVYVTNLLWTVVYDTFYGMTDREYDKKIGVKSTAILFEGSEAMITGSLQCITLIGLYLIGQRFELDTVYTLSILVAAGLMFHQQWLIGQRKTELYFKAFVDNHWVGMTIFLGIALSYALS
ncbi:MAG: 4-hydroxybenzoate polyprenyltransferase [Cellvibrionaceae bacterium]|jgi:4-hydroxybenzoate polyprenyltransferase